MAKAKFNFNPTQFDTTPTIDTQVNVPTEVTPSSILNGEDKPKDNFTIKIIPRKKIRSNKKNRYGLREIESLKESILYFGLQQNLTVIYSVEEDRYILEAGHRRCQALDELIEEFSPHIQQLTEPSSVDKNSFYERCKLYINNVRPYEIGYPCKVNSILKDDIDYDSTESESILLSEARLIITNEDVRSTSSTEKAIAIARLQEIYTKLNIGKKKSEKINVHKQIAENLSITERQVTNYISLNNLLPDLKEEFEKKNITVKEGSEIGKLDEEEQRVILSLLQAGEKVPVEQIKNLKQEKEKLVNSIQEKEKLISKLQQEAAAYESSKQLENKAPDLEKAKIKDDLHRKEEKIKLLQREIKELKDAPPVIDQGATTLYRAELAAKVSHENLIRAQAEFVQNYVAYEKLIHAAPIAVDQSILNNMIRDYESLL